MYAYLVPTDPKSLKIPLDKAIVFIGRHPECDVVLTRSRKVSRKHCAIAPVNNFFVVRDLGSMNGIRLNGQVVQRESRLKIGDEVSIGDLTYVLTVEKGDEPTSRAGRPQAEDVQDAGGTSRRARRPQIAPEDLSQEFPVVISKPNDDGSEDDDSLSPDTPKSIQLAVDFPREKLE